MTDSNNTGFFTAYDSLLTPPQKPYPVLLDDSIADLELTNYLDSLKSANLLDQNTDGYFFTSFPNPFTDFSTVAYSIPKHVKVNVIIMDIYGKEVKQLVNEEQDAGNYQTNFDAINLNAGIYYCTMFTENYRKTIKLILIK